MGDLKLRFNKLLSALMAALLSVSCSNAITGRGSAASSRANGSPSSSAAYLKRQYGSSGTAVKPKATTASHLSTTLFESSIGGYSSSSMNFSAAESSYVTTPALFSVEDFTPLKVNLRSLRGQFHYPVDGYLLSPYGVRSSGMHTGVDIKAQTGDKVYAAFDGVVRLSKTYSSYGKCIVIRHPDGFETLYAHNSKLLVVPGQKVKGGKVIAYAGNTGRSTGSHLHFEIRVHGQTINPDFVIDCTSKSLKQQMLYCVMREGKIVASSSPLHNFGSSSTAKKTATTSSKKYHTVVKGDTLWSIAKKNGTTVAKLCEINKISTATSLALGRKIVLP